MVFYVCMPSKVVIKSSNTTKRQSRIKSRNTTKGSKLAIGFRVFYVLVAEFNILSSFVSGDCMKEIIVRTDSFLSWNGIFSGKERNMR